MHSCPHCGGEIGIDSEERSDVDRSFDVNMVGDSYDESELDEDGQTKDDVLAELIEEARSWPVDALGEGDEGAAIMVAQKDKKKKDRY